MGATFIGNRRRLLGLFGGWTLKLVQYRSVPKYNSLLHINIK